MIPHITLVFSFESEINKEQLQDYLIKSLVGMNCFNLTLGKIKRINGSRGLYLFFEVKNGTDDVKELHNRLYNGMLQAYKPNWLKQVEFMFHITVGNLIDREKMDKAYEYKFS